MAKVRPPVLVPDSDRPLQQGDVFATAGAIALTDTGSDFTLGTGPQVRAELAAPRGASGPGLDVVGGRCLVMVVSHDCQLDKELHLAARRLLREDPRLSLEAAYERVEDDQTLDRNVIVSPVVDLTTVTAAGAIDPGLVRAGRIVGYLPIPQQPPVMPRDALVDLTIRTTVDRLALVNRLASLTDDARIHLRYALARMDALRTPDIGAELAAAVGSRVLAVRKPDAKHPTVTIKLENGQQLDLLPRPGAPGPSGAGGTRRP